MINKIKQIIKQIWQILLQVTSKKNTGSADSADSSTVVSSISGSLNEAAFANSAKPEGATSSVNAKKTQDLIMWGFLAFVLLALIIWIKYKTSSSSGLTNTNEPKTPFKLEVASQALDSEKMWRNYFEDKLIESSKKTQDTLQLLENSIKEQSANYQDQLKGEIEKLREQVKFLAEEQNIAKREIDSTKLRLKTGEEKYKDENAKGDNAGNIFDESKFTVNDLERGDKFDYPKSSRNFIPETAYVKGILLGGIAVSTALGSQSEPVPVIIRITDIGNLPKNFAIDLTHCRIMGSSYGDLSSERAIVRAEVLSCQDPEGELIHTTKIAGLIYGDDGMNGIKGKVVQTSGKHLKNAMIGSMISGFAQSAKGQDQFSITSLGAVNTKQQGIGDMAKQGAFTGASNAAEKIADYYIKQAEAMSPVLLVSGGTKVDIVFTKGVYFGALDVQEKLEQARNSKNGK